jgi:aspartate 1-decarboxylase
MQGTYLKSKLHQGIVTEANVAYEGSVTIDQGLMEEAQIAPYEQIHLWDVTNGTRLVTYAIPAPPGSRTICVNGAGAHLVAKGDQVIIATFFQASPQDAALWRPLRILLNDRNEVIKRLHEGA